MIGLDTNILIRYLIQDDPVQSAKATEIIEGRLTAANPGFLSVVTMAEAVWVLDRAYGLTRREIAAAIERMLQIEVLAVENEQEIFAAMVALKHGHGAFANALIAELGAQAVPTRLHLIRRRFGFRVSSSFDWNEAAVLKACSVAKKSQVFR